MIQVVQIAGALGVLSAFALLQVRVLRPDNPVYLLLNLCSTVVLACVAYLEQQWGFFMLNSAWASISAYSLVRLLRAGG